MKRIKNCLWLAVLSVTMIGGAWMMGSMSGCVYDTETAQRRYSEWDAQMAVSQEATIDPAAKAEIQKIRDTVQKAYDNAVAIAGPDGTVDFGNVVAVVTKDLPEWAWLNDFHAAFFSAPPPTGGMDPLLNNLLWAGGGVAGGAAAPWLTWINAFGVLGRMLKAGTAKKGSS